MGYAHIDKFVKPRKEDWDGGYQPDPQTELEYFRYQRLHTEVGRELAERFWGKKATEQQEPTD